MTIRDWPAAERPREKLLVQGPGALSDAELLAILMHTGTPVASAVDLARGLLERFGGLRGLLSAGQGDFCACEGVGQARYALLQAALEIARRHLAERLQRGDGLKSPRMAEEFLCAQLRDRPYEVFCCLFLDTRHRVVRFAELFRGTIDGATVHPREVVRSALHCNAAAVIVAHNHPSGLAEPSRADEVLTRRLQAALALVDIRLLDHIVIGDGAAVSLSERGLI